ncbi:Protein OSCP1 [Armadillidium vulgare]|nr:Protein OSCP1 [Armadillidium vulgare]
MSHRALPIQFLNLGGEMIYIIDQRLRAQNITDERAHKVRNDIISIMLNKNFVQELFQPQPLYSKSALRTVFHKLAHASIMKLNGASMDKLFDLMLMSLKHQVLLVPQPKDLMLVTLNHLDSVACFATSPSVCEQIMTTRHLLLQCYEYLAPSDWFDIRQDLLMFVQDLNIRVSVFLKSGIQNHFGNLIIPTYGPVGSGCEVPGTVRLFNTCGEISLVTLFPNGGCYACAFDAEDFANLCVDRGTKLGLNMYCETENEAAEYYNKGNLSEVACQNFDAEEDAPSPEVGGTAREELNLLAQLIGSGRTENPQQKEFKLSLFPSEEHEKITRSVQMVRL